MKVKIIDNLLKEFVQIYLNEQVVFCENFEKNLRAELAKELCSLAEVVCERDNFRFEIHRARICAFFETKISFEDIFEDASLASEFFLALASAKKELEEKIRAHEVRELDFEI